MTGMPSASMSFSVWTFVSKYSIKKAKPTPIIKPSTTAMAMFNTGFGSTGVGFSGVIALVSTLTLSTFMISGIISWNTATVSFAISVAKCGSGSLTLTVTTCEFCSLETSILPFNSSGVYVRSKLSMTTSKIALLVMMTLYVLISSMLVRMTFWSICAFWYGPSFFAWLTMNCVLD